MPTVQIQQFHCASPRHPDLERYTKKSCRCQNLPTLTARVSRLTLHDGNLALSSRGFSSIIHPSRGCPQPTKTTKVSSLSSLCSKGSSSTVSSSLLKRSTPENISSKTRSRTPPHQRIVSPNRNSYQSTSAGGQAKCSSLLKKQATNGNYCDSITKKLENTFISRKNIDYDNFSVRKDQPLKRSGVSNMSYKKHNKYSQLLNTIVKSESEQKSESKLKLSSSSDIQLLHPGWRRVPWKSHFGWTGSHEELLKTLRQKIKDGKVESIYYSSEESHAIAGGRWRSVHGDLPFLSGPSVSTVSEVLEVIRKMSASRSPWAYSSRTTQWSRRTTSELSEYDADDEDY